MEFTLSETTSLNYLKHNVTYNRVLSNKWYVPLRRGVDLNERINSVTIMK